MASRTPPLFITLGARDKEFLWSVHRPHDKPGKCPDGGAAILIDLEVDMHSALTCPDIIATVFANLDQPDLSRALRVCRQWNEWSDALWKSLPTLSPLLRLTFPFVFTNDDEIYIQGVPLYQANRARFAQLAKFVHHLDASHTSSQTFFHDYNPDIPGRLLDICEAGSPLFPKLKSLRTQCRNDAELLGILPLLSSSLRSLEISVHHSAVDFMSELFEGIGEHATKLDRLDISCQPRAVKPSNTDTPIQREFDSYVYIPPIGSALSTLSSTLRTLSIPGSCMSTDTFLALSRLPVLQSLSFSGPWCSEVHGDDWPELDWDTHAFPALQHIFLPSSIPAATGLLTAIPDCTPIFRIQVESPSSHPGEDMLELCMALAQFRVSLRCVALKQPQGAEGETVPSWTAAFGALLACGKLEELALDIPFELSDTEAQSLSSHLSCIKTLQLPKSLLSLGALGRFSNMKGLRELEVTTNAFKGPHTLLDSLDSGFGLSDVCLRLDVGASPIQSPSFAAHSIRALFPRRKIGDLVWTTGESDGRWGEVQELLRH